MRPSRAQRAQPPCELDFTRWLATALPLVAAVALLLQLFAAAAAPAVLHAQDGGTMRSDAGLGIVASGSSERLSVSLLAGFAGQEPGDVPQSPALEFIRQMSALDVLFILLWIGLVAYGVRTGVVRQLTLIAALLVGALLAGTIAGPASVWSAIALGSVRTTTLPGTYAILLILITVGLYIAAIKFYPDTRLGRYFVVDRAGGGILGLLAGLIAITVLVGFFVVAASQPWPIMDDARTNIRAQLTSTPFLPLLAASFPLITQFIANSLPVPIKDICERCL